MITYTVTAEKLTELANLAKDTYLQTLQEEGLLTPEQVETMSKYSIIFNRKGLLGRFWDKLRDKNEATLMEIRIVKVLD